MVYLEGIATCAALYLASRPAIPDVLGLHDRVRDLFKRQKRPVNAMESFTGGEQTVVATTAELLSGLEAGRLEDFSLLSIANTEGDFADWRAIAWLQSQDGIFCICMVADEAVSASAWLRDACQLADALDVRYGISYKSPLADYPDVYAMGEAVYTRRHAEMSERDRGRLEAWSEELSGQRRHLSGYFRGAYPASVVSASHLRRLDLGSLNIGSLSALASGLWLWELEDSELQLADNILDAAGVLIR